MTDEEVGKAVEICSKRPSFGQSGYSVTGFAEKSEVEELKQAGLLVEVIPEEELPIAWLEPDADDEAAAAGPAPLAADERPFPQLATEGAQRYVVQFTGPLGGEDHAALTRLDVKLGAYVPDFAYRTALSAEQKAEVESLPFVRRVVFFSPSLTLRRTKIIEQVDAALGEAEPVEAEVEAAEPAHSGQEPAWQVDDAGGWGVQQEQYAANEEGVGASEDRLGGGAGGTLEGGVGAEAGGPFEADVVVEPPSESVYDVICHSAADIPAVADALAGDPRIIRIERGRNRTRIFTGPDAERLVGDIATIDQVLTVEPYRFPEPLSAFARVGIGIGNENPPIWPWDGTGEVVGVIDTGVDTNHPDLVGRVEVIEEAPPEAPDDPHGHGTHVTSIICGDGTASGGACRGIAPGARAIVMSVRGADGLFSGLKPDLSDQFKKLYDRGPRVINASWGDAKGALYTMDAWELDTFVFDNPDCLVVVAAGNDGRQPNPLDPLDPIGRTSYRWITSPASAKNVLTVGACCSPRTDGPYAGKPWRDYRGRLPAPTFPPLAEEPICGNPDVVAAFSSPGPTYDSRLKPEIVAPGTVILAARSAQSAFAFGQPETDFDGHYGYASGTSQACPVVAGAAVIVRQYYIQEAHHPNPSAALLKATLINGATRIKSELVDDATVGYPSFHQGFGRLDMRRTIPSPQDAADGFTLRFVDVNANDQGALTRGSLTQAAWRKRIQVNAGRPLSITLSWTDFPVQGVQTSLDLGVKSPTGQSIWGNPEARYHRAQWEEKDTSNNVERIVVDEPAEGTWTILVNASSLSFTQQVADGGQVPATRPQGFSLVATGQNLSDFF
jgi:hypothetical protein